MPVTVVLVEEVGVLLLDGADTGSSEGEPVAPAAPGRTEEEQRRNKKQKIWIFFRAVRC